jgi:sugar-specific transcriptional regulator TrmB
VQNQEDPMETLVDLGLTHLQAKTYMTLLTLEIATARDINRASNIARQDVYRMLSELDEKGLIERVIGKPIKFKPIPPNKAIFILLQRKRDKLRSLQKKAARTFKAIKYDVTEAAFPDVTSRFILLSKGETDIASDLNRLRKAVAEAETSVMGIMNFELFLRIKCVDEESWKKLAKRGVRCRLITNKTRETPEISLDPALVSSSNFEARWTESPLATSILLVDEKEVYFRMGLDSKSPVLLSMEPSFVALMKDYLETKWKSLEKNQ